MNSDAIGTVPPNTAGDWDIENTGQPTNEVSFTTSEGTWMSVTVSPDGDRIVVDLLGDLFSVPADGGAATLLLGGAAMHRMPVFSADGARLLYLSDADGYDNIWCCNADGSDPEQLTFETYGILTEPSWGPDERSVIAPWIFRAHRELFASQIRLFELDGAGRPTGQRDGRVLVDIPASGRDVLEPALSPDGAWLYYAERLVKPSIYVDANHANFAIKRRRLSDGHTETVVGGFGGAIRPTPSPDGTMLAFIRRVKERSVLFCLDLASGEQRPLFDGLDRDNQAVWEIQGNYYPRMSWFPDSRELAVWARGTIQRIDAVDGTCTPIEFSATCTHRLVEPVRPVHDLVPDRVPVKAIRHLAVAPGGDRTAFIALGRLWTASLSTGVAEPKPVGDHARHAAEPAYSPDGSRLAYVEWDDEAGSTLCLLPGDPAGLDDAEPVEPQRLVSSSGVIRQPSFSPDGTQIVYRIQPHEVNLGGSRSRPGIYLIDLADSDGATGADRAEPTHIGPAEDAPRFSPDGTRIYAVETDHSGEPAEVLFSVDLAGKDRRDHARTGDVDTYELRLSPDGRHLAFRSRHRYYLMPYRETGRVLAATPDTAEVAVRTLVRHGGQALTWAPDGRTVHWCVGPDVFSLAVDDPSAQPQRTGVELSVPLDVPSGTVALTGARVLTMAGDVVHEPGTVLVQGNRIEAVGPDSAVEIPSGATVIDCTGQTIMPGLIDSHGHIDGVYGNGVTPQKQASRYAAMAFGVTTNFDPYPSELPTFESTETTQAGLTVGPRWIGTGSAIHGRPHNYFHLFTPVDDYDDAVRVVRTKSDLGALSVKSYKWPSRRHRQMLVKAAREVGVNIVVEGETHFYNNISMILDGHTNLEHNLPVATLYDDVVQLMAAAGVSNTPTLVVAFGELFGENWNYQRSRSWEDPRIRSYVQACLSGYSPLGTPYEAPPHSRGMTTIHVADELYDIGVLAVSRSTAKLDAAGVRINVGSHGEVPGLAMHWEMALLAEGGMPLPRVLAAATINAAESLGVGHQIGSLEPGKLADLIVLSDNPLDDIAHTESVTHTMVNGRLYDAYSLDQVAPDKRARTRFYWELQDTYGIDWCEAWGGGCYH